MGSATVGADIGHADAGGEKPAHRERLDLGGLLGENVFSTLTGDWTPQHNETDYKMGSIADTAIVSGLHSATMLPAMLRRAAGLGAKDGRLLDVRLDRLRWIKPVAVGAQPDWTVTIEEQVDDGGARVLASKHVVESDAGVHVVAEHVAIVVPEGAMSLNSAVTGLDRELVHRDRGQGLAADPLSIYDPAYLGRLSGLDGPRYLGATPWITVGQFEADAFAEVSGGRLPWHNDPDACRALGGVPVLHAMHLASFAPWAAKQVGTLVAFDAEDSFGTGMAYGFDEVRWFADMPVGAPFRVHVTLDEVVPRGDDRYVISMRQEFERRDDPFVVLRLVWKLIILTAEPV